MNIRSKQLLLKVTEMLKDKNKLTELNDEEVKDLLNALDSLQEHIGFDMTSDIIQKVVDIIGLERCRECFLLLR